MVLGLPFLIELDFELVFEEWGKPELVPREKPVGARGRTSNKLNSHNYAVDAGT